MGEWASLHNPKSQRRVAADSKMSARKVRDANQASDVLLCGVESTLQGLRLDAAAAAAAAAASVAATADAFDFKKLWGILTEVRAEMLGSLDAAEDAVVVHHSQWERLVCEVVEFLGLHDEAQVEKQRRRRRDDFTTVMLRFPRVSARHVVKIIVADRDVDVLATVLRNELAAAVRSSPSTRETAPPPKFERSTAVVARRSTAMPEMVEFMATAALTSA